MLLEKHVLTLRNLDEILKKMHSSIFVQTIRVFSETVNQRVLKLGTHIQVPYTITPAKFQGHSPILTPFTPHMCCIQGHLSQNININNYSNGHVLM